MHFSVSVSYTHLEVGLSLLELDRVELAKEIMEKAGDKLVLPIDNVVAKEFSNDAVATIVDSDAIPADQEGLDIGPKTCLLYTSTKRRSYSGTIGIRIGRSVYRKT